MDLRIGASTLRASLCADHLPLLAGGPAALTFVAAIQGSGSIALLIAADRMHRRPADFAFSAALAGTTLTDPLAAMPDLGGPAGSVSVTEATPWRQPIDLNQYLRLEDAIPLLPNRGAGALQLHCRRRLSPHTAEAAFALRLPVHRDDDALAALVDTHVAAVIQGPASAALPHLDLLLSLRAPAAVSRWRILADHANPAIAARISQALADQAMAPL